MTPQEIVRALEARGMTHHQIAKSIGVTQSSIWRIAAGITTGPKYWVMDSLRLLLGGKTMSREAMQMALEALEDANDVARMEFSDENYYSEAISALRQALETEQEPLYWNVADGWVTADPAEVGEVQAQSELRRLHERCEQWRDIHDAVVADSDKVYALLRQALEALDSDNPDIQLRAATSLRQALVNADDTSQKRVDEKVKTEHEWVGLTDDEIMEPWPFENRIAFARWLESKLKKKNT